MNKNYFKKLALTSVVLAFSFQVQAQNKEEARKLKEKYDLQKLQKIQSSFKKKANDEKARALQIAKQKGWQAKFTTKDGRMVELQRVVDGKPIYYTTFNVAAAKSTRANHLNQGGSLGLNLDGQGMTAYVWDGGVANVAHQEYDGAGGNNRFSIGDGTSTLNFHAEHVTGTIMASGYKAEAKGMAPQASAVGHDWNNDKTEATSAASNGMLLSNHSYGYAFRNRQGQVQLPQYYFGGYIGESRDWDQIMFNAPNYLMVVAAGNDGDDNTANNNPTGGSGWDKLTGHSTSKNNLVVANAQDANIDTNGNLVSVSINSSSSEGPTDDMRIKPDITGNGTNVYSSFHFPSWDTATGQNLSDGNVNNDYRSITGTSMASPNVTGSLLLLQQHYKNLNNGSFMKASTLKGLALHTADDAGSSGPDAVFGWGLLNAKKAAEAISKRGNEAKIEELTLTSGQSYTVTVDSDGTSPLLASISWTDRPGTAVTTVNSTTPVLVNDLDIRVSKSGTTYLPYKLTGPTTSAQQDNNVDPYERVDVANASGTYTITVTHKGSLTGGSQNFSLIVTGLSGTPVVCNATVPTGVTVNGVSATSANISWGAIANASYDVRYRKVGTTAWTTTAVGTTSTSLSGLDASSQYEVQVRSKCSSGNSNYSASVNFTTTEVQLNYCDSKGNNVSDEYIQKVVLGSIDNSSGAGNGYSDHTSLSTNLTKGQSNTITITPKWTGTTYDEGYAVFIDYNKDGDFADAGETVWTKAKSKDTSVSGSFTVPASATSGSTRMRVIMQYNATPSSCGTYNYGETEDYTVVIGNGAPDTQAPTAPASLSASNVEETTLTLSWAASTDNVAVTGYEVFRGNTNIGSTTSATTFNVTGLTAGTNYSFSVKAKDEAGNVSAVSNVVSVTTTSPDTQAPSVPSNVTASNVAQTTATISWSASTDNVAVTGYDVYNGSTLLSSTTSTSTNVTGLTASTSYTISVRAKDEAGNVSANGTVTFTTLANQTQNYCASKGNRSTYEWIDKVSFGGMTNVTGDDGGYKDYTDKVANVSRGATSKLIISAGFRSTAYTEHWAIWIDYNQNGTFEDSEKVASGSSSSANDLSADVTIPATASLGQTRMRVSMKYNSAQTACETFADGEVEDYTVSIGTSASNFNTTFVNSGVNATVLGNEVNTTFNVYPNPTVNNLSVTLKSKENASFRIINTIGRIIKRGALTNRNINVSDLQTGMYVLEVNDGQKLLTKKFIKK